MIVTELINLLRKCPPHLEVVIDVPTREEGVYSHHEVEDINFDDAPIIIYATKKQW